MKRRPESFRFSVSQLAVLVATVAGVLAWWTSPQDVTPGKARPAETGNPTDVAIFGRGWFTLALPSGDTAYTRSGDFMINADGDLVAGKGRNELLLDPRITVPQEALNLNFGVDGAVLARLPGSPSLVGIGQIQVAKFMNPDGLREVLPGVYAETGESGPAMLVTPGTGGTGLLSQGWLEITPESPTRDYGQAAMIAVLGVCGWNLLAVSNLRRQVGAMADNRQGTGG